jgi:NAD-dependent DNA ligase
MYTNNEYYNNIGQICSDLYLNGSINPLAKRILNDAVMYLLNNAWENDDASISQTILEYCNTVWENYGEGLVLEDGMYDLLRESYVNHGYIAPVGGKPIQTKDENFVKNDIVDMITPAVFVNDILNDEDLLYTDMLLFQPPITRRECMRVPAIFANNIDKRKRNTAHQYPNLVGTLEKCKHVMNYQAKELGVFDDSNVRVLERDFFGEHVKRGILDPNRIINVLLMLKFDGVSVEGSMVSRLFTSRGDAIGGEAADLTPIMRNYIFPNAPQNIPLEEDFGVQFEAIMTYSNLYRFNQAKGYNYKNCRSAISGLFSSSDAWKYMEYVTLVPLACSLDIPKNEQLEFLNKYYTRGVYNTYTIISGNLTSILYQIKKFVEEAEMMRDYIDFQYDGVVIEYMDEDIKHALGRENAVNKYAQAVKFNPLKKSTIFKGYTYTVGQDGYITPMIHYEPVEFMGTIHPKSSGHSYERFMELGLREGNIIDVEYVNDVMPYVTKPNNSYNDEIDSVTPPIPFPTHCPVCGSPLEISKSGASAYCKNLACKGRIVARTVNMLDKLGIDQFAEASVLKTNVFSFNKLMELDRDIIVNALNSSIMADKFIAQREALKESNIWDYQIVGAIGFDSMAEETWKLILNKITLHDIINLPDDILYNRLVNIKGIGKVKAKTVIDRRIFFIEDLMYIEKTFVNMRSSFGYACGGKKIRFTGFRDKELVDLVTSLGHDISDKSVTRDTDLLIVVNIDAFNNPSTKIISAQKYGIPIITLEEFLANMNSILS